MIKAAIYARYSSASQREASVEDQIKECRKFADEMEFTVVEIYADRALSGTTDNRPDFQQMIADSAKHQFEYLILYTLDRFARDRYDHAHYKRLLRQNGVKVCYATQRIPDNPEGVILESVLEGYSEYYSKELSRKINRGLLHNAENCMSVGGSVASSKLLSAKEQYDDLKGKLTELYGEPYSYFEENLSTAQDCSVWIGSDGTAVYLKCYHFKERDSESTILCYGLQTSGDTFVLIEEQAISETEQRKNDAMDSIADDYSGL